MRSLTFEGYSKGKEVSERTSGTRAQLIPWTFSRGEEARDRALDTLVSVWDGTTATDSSTAHACAVSVERSMASSWAVCMDLPDAL